MGIIYMHPLGILVRYYVLKSVTNIQVTHNCIYSIPHTAETLALVLVFIQD